MNKMLSKEIVKRARLERTEPIKYCIQNRETIASLCLENPNENVTGVLTKKLLWKTAKPVCLTKWHLVKSNLDWKWRNHFQQQKYFPNFEHFFFQYSNKSKYLRPWQVSKAVAHMWSAQKTFLKISQNSQEKFCARVSKFNKVSSLSSATLLKNRLCHRCFPVNFGQLLRAPFLYNTC